MENNNNFDMEGAKKEYMLKHMLYAVYLLGGIIMILLKFTNIDYIAKLEGRALVQYESLSAVFTVIGAVGILRMLKLLKNEKLLKKYITRSKDERNIMLSNKAMSIAVNISFIAALILDVYYLPINITVSNTIIYFACFILFVYITVYFILNKIM